MAVRVFDIPEDTKNKRAVALKGIEALERFYHHIGMPLTFQEIGAKKEDIDYMVEKLRVNPGELFGNFKKLTLEDAKNIYLLACK